MLDFFINWNKQQLDFILAPLYFHFGSSWLFIEIMVILTDLVDLIATYFIYFLILASIIYFRNSLFISLTIKFFKTKFDNLNTAAILSLINSSLTDLFSVVFTFSKNILTKVKNVFKK